MILTPDQLNSLQMHISIPPPEATREVTLATPPVTFHSTNIKITITDYPKLKEDKHWRTYNRLSKATSTAANHDTLQVLDDTYVPTIEDATMFEQKQYFMYNFFTQTLNTRSSLCLSS